ncbi:hypothetical protein FJT64_001747 [Amphibalanus amphitrite]|uniref:Uncharacterized protein n=1 Tax=Amphibalanus amphitrite TaxID=1232801 RepID=A0A6A4WZ25_AMPAM|nr:hypothetical protein FJT64_001747 [Amphibalanus amphitrite]
MKSDDSDVPPPRPEPPSDAWVEAKLTTLLQEAPAEDGDCGNSSSQPPDWLDDRKLARARRLHEIYWPVINNSQVMSLFLSNADKVRAMHRRVTEQLEGKDLAEVDVPAPGRCPLAALRGDLGPPPAEPARPTRFLSQLDMVLTQWFFVGLVVLHPEKFGLAHLTDDDLVCFVHLWRSIGHRLGVAERHNLCVGSLTQVRALCLQLERRVLVPQLRHPDRCWLGLTHALFDGLGTVFRQCHHDVFLYYILHDVLGLEVPRLYGTLSWLTRLRHRLLRTIFRLANGNTEMHARIRERARAEFVTGVEKEGLPKNVTYVLDLI